MNDISGEARHWAIGDEEVRTDQRFEVIVRAAENRGESFNVPFLLASVRRKVLALFDIETED